MKLFRVVDIVFLCGFTKDVAVLFFKLAYLGIIMSNFKGKKCIKMQMCLLLCLNGWNVRAQGMQMFEY